MRHDPPYLYNNISFRLTRNVGEPITATDSDCSSSREYGICLKMPRGLIKCRLNGDERFTQRLNDKVLKHGGHVTASRASLITCIRSNQILFSGKEPSKLHLSDVQWSTARSGAKAALNLTSPPLSLCTTFNYSTNTKNHYWILLDPVSQWCAVSPIVPCAR